MCVASDIKGCLVGLHDVRDGYTWKIKESSCRTVFRSQMDL